MPRAVTTRSSSRVMRRLERTRAGSARSAPKPWNTPRPRARAYMSQRPCSLAGRPVNAVGSAPQLNPSTVSSARRSGSAGAKPGVRPASVQPSASTSTTTITGFISTQLRGALAGVELAVPGHERLTRGAHEPVSLRDAERVERAQRSRREPRRPRTLGGGEHQHRSTPVDAVLRRSRGRAPHALEQVGAAGTVVHERAPEAARERAAGGERERTLPGIPILPTVPTVQCRAARALGPPRHAPRPVDGTPRGGLD